MKKLICFFTIFVFWGITDSMAQGLHFLGAGAEFALGRNWAMNVEFRYQLVDDFDQGVINFGAAYRF